MKSESNLRQIYTWYEGSIPCKRSDISKEEAWTDGSDGGPERQKIFQDNPEKYWYLQLMRFKLTRKPLIGLAWLSLPIPVSPHISSQVS